VPRGHQCGHVKSVADSAPAAKDGAFAAQFSAVAIKRRHSNQRGNFATVELSQFGHLGQEQGRRPGTNSTNRESVCVL